MGLRSELCHWEEVVLFNIGVDPLGDNLLEEFAGAFHQGDRSIGL